jgi:hypothetical protein
MDVDGCCGLWMTKKASIIIFNITLLYHYQQHQPSSQKDSRHYAKMAFVDLSASCMLYLGPENPASTRTIQGASSMCFSDCAAAFTLAVDGDNRTASHRHHQPSSHHY